MSRLGEEHPLPMRSVFRGDARCQSLDPSDFSLYGFGRHLDAVQQSISHLQLTTGKPNFDVLENAIFAPIKRTMNGGRHVLEAGIFDVAGESWPTDAGRPSQQIPPTPELEIDEEIVYLGWLFGHYGHVMLESLARIWFLSQVNKSVRVVFHAATVPLIVGQRPHSVPWLWRLLEAFGVPYERILILHRPARVRRLFLPEPLWGLSQFAHELAPEPYQAAALRILSDGTQGSSSQPVYLSRRLLPSPQRHTVGEAELENLLQENGVLVVHPQTLTFEDQVRLFNRHTDIFAADGAAIWGTLFALSPPRLHLLVNQAPYPDLFLVSKVVKAQAHFVCCLGSNDRPNPPGSGRLFPYLLDSGPLVAFLEEHGFLRRHLRAVLPVAVEKSQDLHDEAWLYMRVRQAANQSRKSRASRDNQAVLSQAEVDEAFTRADRSWPLCLALAWYLVFREETVTSASSVPELLRKSGELLTIESDQERLARYQDDVFRMVKDIANERGSEIVVPLEVVLTTRLAIATGRKQIILAGK